VIFNYYFEEKLGLLSDKNYFSTKNRHNLLHSLVFLFLNLAIAFTILFRTAYNASDLEIVPDSVEYTVAASRLVTDQSYTIVIDGQSWPPRYPPWFSMLVIAPAYLLFGDEPGNAVPIG
jgi:hypothetical protein